MMRHTRAEAIACPYCGSQLPPGAVFCGGCGRVVDTACQLGDPPAVQELVRRAFAERELNGAAGVVKHEARETVAARELRDYYATLRWLHLTNVRNSLAAVLGLHYDDPGVAALRWGISSTDRVADLGGSATPVLFLTHINGVRVEASVKAGTVTFTGVPDPSRRVPIRSLSTLAEAIDPQ